MAAPAHAAEAIDIIRASYEQNTGVSLADTAIDVHWTSALIPCAAAPGIGCGGLSFGCGSVWVFQPPTSAGITMALAHELGHCARGTLTGDSDGAHVDQAWWSDTGYVELAHRAMRDAGY